MEQLTLFSGEGGRPYRNTFAYVNKQWDEWEANNQGKIFNFWYGKLKKGTIVNVGDNLESRDILMFQIHHGGRNFTHEPAPDFQKYRGYPYNAKPIR